MIELKNGDKQIYYDETHQFLSTRYVCPPEVMHRLYEFKMHQQSHGTIRLKVHLDNHQQICFKEELKSSG